MLAMELLHILGWAPLSLYIYILIYVAWHVLAQNQKVVIVGDVIWRHLSCMVRRSNMPFHTDHNDVNLHVWLIMLYWLHNMIIRIWTRQRYMPGQTHSHEYNFSVKQTLTLSGLRRWVVISSFPTCPTQSVHAHNIDFGGLLLSSVLDSLKDCPYIIFLTRSRED